MRRVVLSKGERFRADMLNRKSAFDAKALAAATEIIEDVRERTDEALRDYTKRFDGVEVARFRVDDRLIDEADQRIDAALYEALVQASRQIRDFHERQRQQSWFTVREDGALVGAKVTPLDSVGIYVPGGRALYPSTVLMNAIPAQVAGVQRIVCVTPPSSDGTVDAAILCACKLAGVTEVYTVGGAQALAALAYGTESIEPVAKITGPGNAYVAAAKKLVAGDVGIDMIAGPSEVCVVADETADPALVAIDLMAQAEHDPLATCYLVAFDEAFIDDVEGFIEKYRAQSSRADITMSSLDNQGLAIVCATEEQAVGAVNIIAPEHLELQVAEANEWLGAVRHAGAIFLGAWTPEAIGDYVAGPNHTLPTGGTASYASPLSVDEFVKKQSVIRYSAKALANDADAVVAIATHEGLWAHAKSVELRQEKLKSLLDAAHREAVIDE